MPILFSNMPKKTLTKSHVLRHRKFIYLIFMKCNNFDEYFFFNLQSELDAAVSFRIAIFYQSPISYDVFVL